jgi:hypothetical protein
MAARNFIQFSIPLTLTSGGVIQTTHCMLTADALEGFATDPVNMGDRILLGLEIASGAKASETFRIEYRVTHAHPEAWDGQPCTWFMAVPSDPR